MDHTIYCTNCGAKLTTSDDSAGQHMKCPKCGTVLTVPELVYDAEAILEPGSPGNEPGGEARRPCPMCGEMIVATAAKCRYCGEIFDPALRKAEALKTGNPEDADLTPGDWVLAILCSGIGCIIGIVWMIQGKPKGKKMFGVAILFVILWNVVVALLQQAKQP